MIVTERITTVASVINRSHSGDSIIENSCVSNSGDDYYYCSSGSMSEDTVAVMTVIPVAKRAHASQC